MPFESRAGFKLTEVAKNVYEIPGGLYRGSFAYLMNQDVFDGLPTDIQQALNEEVFGEPASRMVGAVWDEIDAGGRAATEAAGDNTINAASAADLAAYKPISENIIKNVLAEIGGKGIDAEAAYDMVKSEMAAN